MTALKVRHHHPIPERDNHVNRSRLAALSAGAMFLVASVLVPATALAAGSGTLTLSPGTVSTSTGSTFTVTVSSQASTALSGASAALDFDKTQLQVVSIAKGTDWNVAGTTWQVPTVSDIATANANGHLPSIGAFFTDGTSSRPGTTQALAVVTFFAIATGSPTISITASGPHGASLIDGSAASYGTPVATTVGGNTAVTIAAGTGVVGTGSVNSTATVTGTVAAPSLALTCPPSVTVPLVRGATNNAPFTCSVATDGSWTLSVKDTNPDANHGHLVDGAQTPVAALANPLSVVSPSTTFNLASAPDVQPIYSSQANATVPLSFQQVVSSGDKPGSYGMSVLFSIVNTF
jgi:hypothetical protein